MGRKLKRERTKNSRPWSKESDRNEGSVEY